MFTRVRWDRILGVLAVLTIALGVFVATDPLCDGDCGPAARFFGVGITVFGVLLALVAWGLRPLRR